MKDIWRRPSVNSETYAGDLRDSSKTHCQFRLKRTDRSQNERRLLSEPQHSTWQEIGRKTYSTGNMPYPS